ncbi:MAG TPA: adenosylcobinamide-GDP ribazoletransferase [Euzebya sp.]|nr:adenosylcobinamide-GDP ribazoletransferase [Euzebya sp.]
MRLGRREQARPRTWPVMMTAAVIMGAVHPRLLLVALQLLTRLPVGDPWHDEADTARSVGWFAVVGALVGGVAASTWWITALALPRLAAAAVALVVILLLTGGLHEDGLADTADGFFGAADPTTRLAIMRDSSLGTFGVLALITTILLRVTLLASLPPVLGAGALVSVSAISRGVLGAAALGAAPAAADGRGAALLNHLAPGPALTGLLTAAVVAAMTLRLVAVPVLAAGLLAAVGIRVVATRRLGGLTGDVLGSMIVCAEVLGLLVIAVVTGELATS